jgi:uncharacterized repeat protein (TIGR01451 family)
MNRFVRAAGSSALVAGISSTLLLSGLPAVAGTNVSNTPSFSITGEAIGYTVDAVSLSNSFGTTICTLTPSRNFNITLPVGATVKQAILYWATDLTAGDSQITLAGTTINATKSWNDTILTTTQTYNGYRADVTSQIAGTGTYSFSGLNSASSSPFSGGCLSGASLVVIYNTTRTDPNALNRIEMFDGFEGIRGAGLASGGGSSTVTLPINSLGSDLSFMTALSWQGNSIIESAPGNYPDSLTVSGTAISNANNPVNDNGNGSGANQLPNSVYAVDADTFDVSSIVAGSTSLTLTNTSGNADYVISQGFIFGSRGPDVSDAPNSGGFNYGIARHKIVPTLDFPTLYLGKTVDGEVVDNTYVGSLNADFDDTNGVNDDDGITLPPLLSGATSYSIPVGNITAHGMGTLHAWIDFNKNGTFDPGEYTSVAVMGNTPAAALNWTGITAGAVGSTYARFRFTTDATVTANTPSGIAADGEVEDYKVPIAPANNPVPPSICSVAGGIRGTNLFANDGTFGTGSSTPGSSTTLPPGRTTYTFEAYGSTSPNDGNYAIVNQLNQNTYTGIWHNTFGHTTGTIDDQMMVVNAAATPGTFYTEILTVPANQNIEFSAWILNLVQASRAAAVPIQPNISFVINRIGVDDNNNGTIDEPGEGQVITTTGSVPNANTPTWLNYGAIINTGNATQIEYRLVNNAPGGGGNDLLLDDLFAAPCSPLPQGNITGTLYRDTNTNNLYNSGTDTTLPANIAVNLKSATGVIVATAYTDASGNYDFTNVPAGSNYTIEVALTDPDIPSGATATANPMGANTTGQQSGITVTNGATLANQNFGFSAPAVTVNGTCQPDGLVWVSGASGQIGYYRVSNQAFTTISNGTGKVWGDIAWASDNKLYGATFVASPSLYQIDPTTGASTLVASLTGVMRFPNAISGLPDNSLLIGAASNAKVYRLDLTTPSNPPTIWHDFGAGDPSGDFILFNNKIYVAWRNAGTESLYEVTIDANHNYISHRNLGALPANSWGLALVLNKLYIASNTTLYRINGIPTNPMPTIPVTAVVQNTPYPLYGATGIEEPFGGCTAMTPNLLLVKRITAINNGSNTIDGDSLSGYIDSLTNPYDDNVITIPTQATPADPAKDTTQWPTPNTFLIGGINGGNVKPGDEMEYTIYFLSAGDAAAKNVLFCDRVPTNVSFIPTAFNSATPAVGGLAGDRGILSLLNGATTAFTNIADGDAARYFAPGSDPTSIYPNIKCGGPNDNGAIVVNLGDLPNATVPGSPAGAFGFVRFKGRVK